MIPLFAAHHLAFAADLLGMSLKTIRGVHRSAGFMVFLLGLLHAVVVVASNVSLHLDVTRDMFAVIVCVPPLICISLTDNGIGRVAPLSLLLLVFLPFRRRYYDFFLRTHQALAMASAYTVWCHLPSDKPTPRIYLYVSAGLIISMFLLQSYSVIRRNKISWYPRGLPLPTFRVRLRTIFIYGSR